MTNALIESPAAALDAIAAVMPVRRTSYALAGAKIGKLDVDPVKGFAAIGGGNLAPPVANAQVTRMIAEIGRTNRLFIEARRPVAVFLDTHEPGKPEFPYPPHCEAGTGEENLVDELAWLDGAPGVTLMRKDCINGVVGTTDAATGRNRLFDWIADNGVEVLVVDGICTDICVLQAVQALLSARNHGMTGPLREIVVHEPGCATYDLPLDVARGLGLPDTAAHPQMVAHHVGLYLMQASGAVIADELRF
ncbi:isochorismatase family protein [Azospirillum picis]|uniref:Nicotinamidase-related amidase n=1 Tax=Azospirillum picis TaxID=488438 RepID=A0ABU0MJW4_9PROT|nr:isochorismatase family protein [Azospirillum picis]MBP2299863.1 nicotinamidase-related amidase [Azospirillum picis]MDQ0533659.1 nicotinamidase-related amidase [Azospirillum picis]